MTGPAWLWPSLALAFVLELCGLAAYGWWGVQAGTTGLSRTVLGVGAPLVAAVLWGVFAAPRAPVSSAALAAVVQVGFFAGAALVLAVGGHARLAGVLLVVVLVNTAVLHLARGQGRASPAAAQASQ